MKAKTAKQVLDAMYWMIKNIGWNQGSSFSTKNDMNTSFSSLSNKNPPTAMCIYGAYCLVEADNMRAKKYVWSAICLVNCSPVSFNDSPSTSKKDILKLIKSAKDKLP